MNRPLAHRTARSRQGVIVVLTCVLLVFMLALIALAIDVGYLAVAKVQLQEAADAAALAATAELIDDEALSGAPSMTDEIAAARSTAVQYAAANKVCRVGPVIDPNTSNAASGDVVIGHLADPSNRAQTMSFSNPSDYNSVQVRVRRTANMNGEVHLFFATIFGTDSHAVSATATAAMLHNVKGFETPDDDSNIQMLPIVLLVDTWNEMLAGHGPDKWGWSPDSGSVNHKGDNVLEMNLYPESTSSPGNVGTIDIGTSDNSTDTLARQILYGISPADLAAMPGGQFALGADGTTTANGDTGISASIQKQLSDIRGKPRVIPLYDVVNFPGNNAQFRIVGFVGIRILDVDLTGALKNKRLTIQRAHVTTGGVIPGGNTPTSQYVHSPVWLVR